MIIDAHGHYTTVPPGMRIFRALQISNMGRPTKGTVTISDDEIRVSLEKGQIRLLDERGIDVMLFSPMASAMGHHFGNAKVSRYWTEVSNDLIHRVCSLYPDRFAGVCALPQSPGVPPKECCEELARCVKEFGFVGCVSILLLYAAVIFMALRTAYISHSHFGRLAAAGITVTFALYVLINGAMVMGLAPVVGVPMPLLSYGGTVMLTVMVGFGLVLAVRVNRYSEVTSGKGALL